MLLAGAVIGAFLALAFGPAPEPELRESPAPEVLPTQGKLPRDRPSGAAEVEDDADDLRLAGHLEQARFDSDWERALAVASVLRDRAREETARPMTDRTAQPAVAPGRKPSLVAVERSVRLRSYRKELEARDNPARQAALRGGSGAERVARLRELFLAPLLQPEDRQVRADAAFYLATSDHDEAQDLLLQTLSDPDAERADLAAASLARSDEPDSLRALAQRLEREPDVSVRLRIVSALAEEAAPAPIAAAALHQAAERDSDLDVRQAALAGLARCELGRDDRLLGVLTQLLGDDTAELRLRQASVKALHDYREVAHELPRPGLRALLEVLERARGPLLQDVARLLGEAAADPAPLEAVLVNVRDPESRQALEVALESIKARVQR